MNKKQSTSSKPKTKLNEMEPMSVSEQMQDELEPIVRDLQDESDDIELAKAIETDLLDGNGIERYKSPELTSLFQISLTAIL